MAEPAWSTHQTSSSMNKAVLSWNLHYIIISFWFIWDWFQPCQVLLNVSVIVPCMFLIFPDSKIDNPFSFLVGLSYFCLIYFQYVPWYFWRLNNPVFSPLRCAFKFNIFSLKSSIVAMQRISYIVAVLSSFHGSSHVPSTSILFERSFWILSYIFVSVCFIGDHKIQR